MLECFAPTGRGPMKTQGFEARLYQKLQFNNSLHSSPRLATDTKSVEYRLHIRTGKRGNR
ncbi:unknown protein [Microcystis aeruginosa NIES-843]|uniref:Uncharacterized protein n=1 Tax=Microcystis aeruginosa (strain NIES-843 / IAM M-2473) TaxID=449447 RepID=B0JHK7_MICAN|nr:unknown protein [Microcystis aeruginosa NIES-843]